MRRLIQKLVPLVDLDPTPRALRTFGLAGLAILPAVGVVGHFAFDWPWQVTGWLALAGALNLACAVLAPPASRIVYLTLIAVTAPIGFVVSHVLLFAIWILMMTPFALWFRMTGRDILGLRPDPAASSYWHIRGAQSPPARYFKLY